MKTNDLSVSIGILVVAAIAAGGYYFVEKLAVASALAENQKLYASIPTDAGKGNFMKQSMNMTKIDRLTLNV